MRRYTANGQNCHLGYAETPEDALAILKLHGAEDTGYVFDTHLHRAVFPNPDFRPIPGLATVADREMTEGLVRDALKPMIEYAIKRARAAQQNYRYATEEGDHSEISEAASEAYAAELLVEALDEAESNVITSLAVPPCDEWPV